MHVLSWSEMMLALGLLLLFVIFGSIESLLQRVWG
jgi:hypothetical protein